MTPREWFGRGFIILGGAVALGAILACPKPVPTPVGPADADASPPAVSCGVACAKAKAVCPSIDQPTCVDLCPRIGGSFAAQLAIATGCPDVKAAGGTGPSGATGSPRPIGR